MKRAGLVFLSAAALSGVSFSAARAHALTVRTIGVDGCHAEPSAGSILCGLTLGTDMPPSSLTGIYADLQTYSEKSVAVSIARFSYTGGGSVSDDWEGTPSPNGNGYSDIYIPLVYMPKGSSLYDYGMVFVSGADHFVGIAYLSSK